MNFYKLMNTKEGILMLFKFLLTKELTVAIDFYSMKKMIQLREYEKDRTRETGMRMNTPEHQWGTCTYSWSWLIDAMRK